MSNLSDFIRSRTFIKHIVIICLSFILLIALTSIILSIYTDHGEKYPMPDLRGLTMEQALEASSDFDFEFKIIDSVYVPDLKKGTVIDHSPKPGFNIKRSRVVFITMNSINPEFIKMPDLVNTSLRQAKSTMESYGLVLGRLHYKPDFAENYVLQQFYKGKRIQAGNKVPKGSRIDLVLGLGTGDGSHTNVPDVYGFSLSEASTAIAAAKLNIGAKVFDPSIKTFTDSLDAKVWKQDPPADEKLQPGSLVDIWLKNSNNNAIKSQTDLNEFENE